MADIQDRSAPALMGDLVTHVTELVRKEIQLLRAELNEKATQAAIALGSIVAGVIIAITALNVAYGPEDPGTSGTPGQPSTVSAAVSLSGAALLTLPNAGEPPVLLLHGTADVVVPYSWAQTTVDRAHAAGTQAYLTSWEGLGHVPYVQKRTEILDQTTNFLYWTMQLVSAAR